MEESFVSSKHIKYFQRCLQVLPNRYASLDTSRMTIAFFALSGLDLLNGLNVIENDRNDIVEWIYSLQILPQSDDSSSGCGFRGSTTMGAAFSGYQEVIPYDNSHVAMTYTALATLLVLGDDFSRVNRNAVLSGLTKLQLANGSFSFTIDGSENDMRFLYCAACICYMLNDFSTIDTSKAVDFIVSSQSYEGGFGQGPFLEAHGGSTFCAVASLYLFKRLDALDERKLDKLKNWCLLRQQSGFQGRPNKPVDTCYSFWLGATLQLLGVFDKVDFESNRCFLLSTQDYVTGGFSKWESTSPDPLHSYMGLAALALMNESELKTIYAPLNISEKALNHLHKLQSTW